MYLTLSSVIVRRVCEGCGVFFSLVEDSVTSIYKSSLTHPLFLFCSWREDRQNVSGGAFVPF